MIHGLNAALSRALLDRATLALNHVLNAEPVATARLAPRAGRCVRLRVDGWPGWLGPAPAATLRVTPAGLFELADEVGADAVAAPDLQVVVDAGDPLRTLGGLLDGQRPAVEVSGDAAFATDLNWLFANLRWDAEDDLARLVGPAPAREIARLGGAVAVGLRRLLQSVASRRAGGSTTAPPRAGDSAGPHS